METGDKENAIKNYQKSLELNPGNDNAKAMLAKMGIEMESSEVEVAAEILETYVGKYELVPGFVITVTREDQQLTAQATGQPSFQIFPTSETKFFLKVVDAQITFNRSDSGEVESLTLHQNGQNMPGKKIE